jgi:hypothetical protein
VHRDVFPSRSRVTIEDIFVVVDVKGAAIDASASERDSPISAVLSALQSFAPSPHIPTTVSLDLSFLTKKLFSSEVILAKTFAFLSTF